MNSNLSSFLLAPNKYFAIHSFPDLTLIAVCSALQSDAAELHLRSADGFDLKARIGTDHLAHQLPEDAIARLESGGVLSLAPSTVLESAHTTNRADFKPELIVFGLRGASGLNGYITLLFLQPINREDLLSQLKEVGEVWGAQLDEPLREDLKQPSPQQHLKGIDIHLLAATLEYANDSVIITDCDLIDEPGPKILYVNLAFEQQTGYSREEVIGRNPRFLHGLNTSRAALDEIRAKLAAQQPVRLELLNYHKDGSEYWTELSIRPLMNSSGHCTHFISVQRDVTSRKRDEQELQRLNQRLARRLKRLTALREIDQAIAASVDLNLTLSVLLSNLVNELEVDAAAISLLDPDTLMLETKQRFGFRQPTQSKGSQHVGEGIAGRAALERRQVEVLDTGKHQTDSKAFKQLIETEGFHVYIAVPLIAKGDVKGVLGVFHRQPLEPDDEWREFLTVLAGQAAIAIDNLSLFEELQRSNIDLRLAYDETIEGWSRALDLRDKETEGHTQRVTSVTVMLAKTLGVERDALMQLTRGALLHDIGKMGIPDSILLKPGALTPEERKIIEGHPDMAYELLAPIHFLSAALDIPYAHHERWDGTGYPRGLKGEQIPLAARIFAVIDVWDALRSDRPYRAGWREERVVEHIRLGSGSHFDPRVVKAFLEVVLPSLNQPSP